MAVHILDLKAPSLDEPRMEPCQVTGIGVSTPCRATPASLWTRSCLNGHSRNVWLCGTHAEMCTKAMIQCAECVDHGFPGVAVSLKPVRIMLAR